MSIDFQNPKIGKYMLEGYFGLEKECLRVTPEGYLAHTKHPFINQPNIERDFCENQAEFITDVEDSTGKVRDSLALLQKKANDVLKNLKTGAEYLWPFSNPPYVLGEKDIFIANYQGDLQGKRMYREYLAKKYGKKKMLFPGFILIFPFQRTFWKRHLRQVLFLIFRNLKIVFIWSLRKR